ncbi:MAG: hypothetical protein ACXWCZ_01840 [Flavisolibacter sp.]|jgi:hypothetical protein
MGLLNQGKKGDKKAGNKQKNAGQQSKFISKGGSKPAGGSKKGMMTGGANRGS